MSSGMMKDLRWIMENLGTNLVILVVKKVYAWCFVYHFALFCTKDCNETNDNLCRKPMRENLCLSEGLHQGKKNLNENQNFQNIRNGKKVPQDQLPWQVNIIESSFIKPENHGMVNTCWCWVKKLAVLPYKIWSVDKTILLHILAIDKLLC